MVGKLACRVKPKLFRARRKEDPGTRARRGEWLHKRPTRIIHSRIVTRSVSEDN